MYIYLSYCEFKAKYIAAQRKYDAILQEKEYLFAKTQPKSPKFDKNSINSSNNLNVFDEYLIAIERKHINSRLEEIRSILADRERLLKLKEQELTASNNIMDRIYKYRYLDNLSVGKIARLVSYSKSQVYRILVKMQNQIF